MHSKAIHDLVGAQENIEELFHTSSANAAGQPPVVTISAGRAQPLPWKINTKK